MKKTIDDIAFDENPFGESPPVSPKNDGLQFESDDEDPFGLEFSPEKEKEYKAANKKKEDYNRSKSAPRQRPGTNKVASSRNGSKTGRKTKRDTQVA